MGGSAHPGGGIPLVGMSAKIVADLVGAGGARPAGRRTRSRTRRTPERGSSPASQPAVAGAATGPARPGASPRSVHTSSVAVEEFSV